MSACASSTYIIFVYERSGTMRTLVNYTAFSRPPRTSNTIFSPVFSIFYFANHITSIHWHEPREFPKGYNAYSEYNTDHEFKGGEVFNHRISSMLIQIGKNSLIGSHPLSWFPWVLQRGDSPIHCCSFRCGSLLCEGRRIHPFRGCILLS